MSSRLVLLVLTSALAVALGFWSFTPSEAVSIVRWGGYWITLLAVVAFLVVLVRSLRDVGSEVRLWRTWALPVGVAFLATAFLHLHEPHELKIVADEVVLQLTAKQLHFGREASVVARGYEYAGNFTPFVSYVDKRPLLFPFLLSTVHDVSGYRPGNVYVLNAILSGGLMLLLLLIGRRIAGWGAGIAAVMLVTTIPLVAQNACGAGFEILNLVMILLVLWLGMRAGEQPENSDRLGAFVLAGVLLAVVRYESALFVAPVAATVMFVWWRNRRITLPWPLLIAPLLLVIVPLHLNVFKILASNWQLTDVAGADHPFGLRYFYDNIGHALNFFLDTQGLQPNSLLVAVAGVLGVGLFILTVFCEHRRIFREQPGNAVLCIFIAALLVHTALMLCYFWGRWDDPVIRRLSLPAHLLLVLAFVFSWPRLISHSHRWVILSGAALAYLVAFTVPSSAMHRFTQENFAARSANWLASRIRELGDESALSIGRSGGLVWFLYDKANIQPGTLAQRPESLIVHFRNRSFAHFLVVQRLSPVLATGGRMVWAEDDLGDGIKLEKIEERVLAPLYLVRLSRITSIDEPKLRAWAAQQAQLPPPPTRVATPASDKDENDRILEWLRQLP